LTSYEDGLCPGCGQPKDRAWNDDMADLYATHRATCIACQTVHTDTDAHKPGPADRVWVTDVAPHGFEPDPRLAARG
jgi:hypothetical protein